MSTIDQQFVEYIVKSLVENSDDVVVDRIVDEKGVLLTLTVNPEDLGRVIGRRGVTAQSLRTLLRALGTKNSARYNLKIVNNDEPQESVVISSDDNVAEDGNDTSTVDDNSVAAPDDNAVVADEPVDDVDNSTDEVVDNEPSKASEFAKKSREELAELDDLDI